MWPKVLMQLFELLPHVTRLVPLADKYLSSRTANERANEAALTAMAEGVQADLGQVTKAHAGLYSKLIEQGSQIAELNESVRLAQQAIERQDKHIDLLNNKLASANLWIKISASLTAVLLILVIVLLTRGH
ncbi:hypothetical protein [Edaphobacter flagellatus]|uniref:hypothetical protein n=1 Tax=Edaphobacter flagellatus TaxID=1933044 RepID=UPI0021B46F38|nr:hypothetical protein [Edaphobacter flagellatus]